MNKLHIPFVIGVLAAGLFVVLKFGVHEAPVTIMEPAHYSRPEEIGRALHEGIGESVADQRVVAFGVPPQPEWHQRILRGFLRAAEEKGVPFDLLVIEEQMPRIDLSEFTKMEKITLSMNSPTQAELIETLDRARTANQRVLIATVSLFSTHILRGNPINRYEKSTGTSVFSITTGPLSLRPDQEHLVDPPCVGSARDAKGTAELGCAMLAASRSLYRKQLASDQYIAMSRKHGPRPDHLLLVSFPGQDKIPTSVK